MNTKHKITLLGLLITSACAKNQQYITVSYPVIDRCGIIAAAEGGKWRCSTYIHNDTAWVVVDKTWSPNQ